MPSPYYNVNVPIPAASGPGDPGRVVFSMVSSFAGAFNWGCVILCGESGMEGPMYGSLVAS